MTTKVFSQAWFCRLFLVMHLCRGVPLVKAAAHARDKQVQFDILLDLWKLTCTAGSDVCLDRLSWRRHGKYLLARSLEVRPDRIRLSAFVPPRSRPFDSAPILQPRRGSAPQVSRRRRLRHGRRAPPRRRAPPDPRRRLHPRQHPPRRPRRRRRGARRPPRRGLRPGPRRPP